MKASLGATRKPRAPAVPSLCILGSLAAALGFGRTWPALAGEPAVNVNMQPADTELAQAATPSGAPLGQAVIPPQPTPPFSQDPYALADELKLRGQNIPLPDASDTVDQGLFGVRNAAADLGISWLVISNTTFSDNILRHALPAGNYFGPHSRDNQLYSGQLPTYNSANNFVLSYDLRRYGVPDGQLSVSAEILTTNWNPGGPNSISLNTLTYYQTLFDKKVEIKLGYLNDSLEFLGTEVGGSLANGVFGPNSSLAVENGLDGANFSTLGLNVKFNLPLSIYDKVGISRGISPDGSVAEKLANPTGLNLTVTNAGINVFNETGYRVNAAPGQYQTWIRAATSITTSRYEELNDPTVRDSPNYGLYLLADRQLLQTAPNAGPGSAVRGVYAGFSVEYAPPRFNRFSQYYEARVYGFGLIPGRPYDLASVVLTRNVFSGDAVRLDRSDGLLAHDNVDTYAVSYGARILPGLSLNTALQFTDNPTPIAYTRSTGSSLSILSNIFIFL